MYNKKGYYIRAKAIQELTAKHYEPGRQDRSYKWVWRYHILPLYGICYVTFLKYIKVKSTDNPIHSQSTLF